MFLDDTACNLASLNLLKFESKNSDPLIRGVQPCGAAVDARARHLGHDGTVSLKEIARRSYDYRTLGLGYANLAGS